MSIYAQNHTRTHSFTNTYIYTRFLFLRECLAVIRSLEVLLDQLQQFAAFHIAFPQLPQPIIAHVRKRIRARCGDIQNTKKQHAKKFNDNVGAVCGLWHRLSKVVDANHCACVWARANALRAKYLTRQKKIYSNIQKKLEEKNVTKIDMSTICQTKPVSEKVGAV